MEKGDAAGFAKTLLKEISATGVRTKDIFDASIENLHQTVITSLLHSNQSQAALAIDIMDRNLYERANDCRWWAVNPIFAKLLAQDRCTEDDAKTIGAILRLLVQYLALRHAPERPAVITTTTAAALNLLRTAGLLSRPDFDSLAGAHSFYGDVMQATVRARDWLALCPGLFKGIQPDPPPTPGNASSRENEAQLCHLEAGVKNVFGRFYGRPRKLAVRLRPLLVDQLLEARPGRSRPARSGGRRRRQRAPRLPPASRLRRTIPRPASPPSGHETAAARSFPQVAAAAFLSALLAGMTSHSRNRRIASKSLGRTSVRTKPKRLITTAAEFPCGTSVP